MSYLSSLSVITVGQLIDSLKSGVEQSIIREDAKVYLACDEDGNDIQPLLCEKGVLDVEYNEKENEIVLYPTQI